MKPVDLSGQRLGNLVGISSEQIPANSEIVSIGTSAPFGEYPGYEAEAVTLPNAFNYLGNLAKKDQIG